MNAEIAKVADSFLDVEDVTAAQCAQLFQITLGILKQADLTKDQDVRISRALRRAIEIVQVCHSLKE